MCVIFLFYFYFYFYFFFDCLLDYSLQQLYSMEDSAIEAMIQLQQKNQTSLRNSEHVTALMVLEVKVNNQKKNTKIKYIKKIQNKCFFFLKQKFTKPKTKTKNQQKNKINFERKC